MSVREAASVVGSEERVREVSAKLGRVRAWLDRSNVGSLLLGSQPSFAWITAGGRSHVSIGEPAGVASIFVTREEAFALTPNIERRRIVDEEIAGLGFVVVDYPWHRPDGLAASVAAICDPARAVSDIGAGGLAPGDGSDAELRRVLRPEEQQRYRRLGRDAATALEAAARDAQPGDTELDVAARIAHGCLR